MIYNIFIFNLFVRFSYVVLCDDKEDGKFYSKYKGRSWKYCENSINVIIKSI